MMRDKSRIFRIILLVRKAHFSYKVTYYKYIKGRIKRPMHVYNRDYNDPMIEIDSLIHYLWLLPGVLLG